MNPLDMDPDGLQHLCRRAGRELGRGRPLQQPRPITMSAGGSPKGKAFAAHVADYLFAVVRDAEDAKELVAAIGGIANSANRNAHVFTISHVVCRETQREAEEVYRYFAETMADREGIENWSGCKIGDLPVAPNGSDCKSAPDGGWTRINGAHRDA
jgi:alkanesulfonate monooxygenase SsuD/methylene tetrahydromethanopterin reductase-like flavin-dependent oxidoreductase (luciferase family)